MASGLPRTATIRVALLVCGLTLPAGCGSPAPPAVVRPPSVAGVTRAALPALVLRQFVNDLRTSRSASLRLELPERGTPETVVFTLLDRPVPDSMLPDVLFARGVSEAGNLSLRVLAISAAEVRVSVFAADSIHVATLRPDAPVVYRQVLAASGASGRNCDVRQEDDRGTAAGDVALLSMGRVPPATMKRLSLVVATTPALRQEYPDPVTLDLDIAEAVTVANVVFNRDLGVDLFVSSPPLSAPTVDFIKPDALTTLHRVIMQLAEGREMDIGHLLDLGGGGKALIDVVCSPMQKGAGYSRTPDRIMPNGVGNFIHELGHQLGALHSYNAADKGRQRRGAFEPGWGVSVMSYGDDRRHYFHASSMALVARALADAPSKGGGVCGTDLPATAPRPALKLLRRDWTVPPLTPFEVAAVPHPSVTGYRWDAYDRGRKADAQPPYFASRNDLDATRVYPFLDDLTAASARTVTWPQAREMRFRVVGFGSDHLRAHDDLIVRIGPGRPFRIVQATCQAPCAGGSRVQVTWTAGTHRPPYSVATLRADVLDATDPSQPRWHPIPAAGSLDNTRGFADITIPHGLGAIAHARLVLRANDGIFLALSDRLEIVDLTTAGGPGFR